MAGANPKPGIWDPVDVKPDTLYRGSFSTLIIWLKRSSGDWYLASERPREEADSAPLSKVKKTKPQRDLKFSRWVVGEEASTVQFVPAMPDRAIVVRPAATLRVPTGKDALFFTSIPIWIRVVAEPPSGITLCELPTMILSNTWFGEPTSGELCYALRTRAVRTLEEIEPRAYTAICPVTIRNRAPRELNFERLCLRVENLGVFKGRKRLWTNELNVVFQGEQLSTQITIGKGAPSSAQDPTIMCEARQQADRTLLKQSFSFLRSLTEI